MAGELDYELSSGQELNECLHYQVCIYYYVEKNYLPLVRHQIYILLFLIRGELTINLE